MQHATPTDLFEPRLAEPLVRRATELVRHGAAVDLGSGLGFDALHLAWHGLSVLAIDRNAEPLAHLAAVAARRNLRLSTWIGDALAAPWPDEVDVVVMSRMLHFLDRDSGLALVAEAKRRTSPGGVHVVIAFGGGYDEVDRRRLFVERDELRALYAGWDEVAGRSEPMELAQVRPDGTRCRLFQHATLMRRPEAYE